MEMASAWSTSHDEKEAIQEAFHSLKESLGKIPQLIYIYCSAEYNSQELLHQLNILAPSAATQGGTSCLGIMTESGFHSENGFGLGLLGIHDEEGHYGVGSAEIGTDGKSAAKSAIHIALEKSDCPGQIPTMVWMTAAPGFEEDVISGIQDVIGVGVPIIGGSSADNTVSGKWKQFADQKILSNGVVITVMFPSCDVRFAFHSGYEPTTNAGVVTRATGRILNEIDHRPAAEVYNTWSDGLISDFTQSGGNILSLVTLHPLGRIVGNVRGVPYFQLAHPDTVTHDGSLTLFADINEGEKLVFMSGTKDSLVSRASRVARSSLNTHSSQSGEIYGAIVVYCAGCMLTVQDRMDEVVDGLNNTLKNKPLLGIFTFGEQGCFIGGENRHGNLMISVLTFSK